MKINISIEGLPWPEPINPGDYIPPSVVPPKPVETTLFLETPDTAAALEQIEPFVLRALGCGGEPLEMPSADGRRRKIGDLEDSIQDLKAARDNIYKSFERECRKKEQARKNEAEWQALAEERKALLQDGVGLIVKLRSLLLKSGIRLPKGSGVQIDALRDKLPK